MIDILERIDNSDSQKQENRKIWQKNLLIELIDGKIQSPEIGFIAEKKNNQFEIIIEPSRIRQSNSFAIINDLKGNMITTTDGSKVSFSTTIDSEYRFTTPIIGSKTTVTELRSLWEEKDIPSLGNPSSLNSQLSAGEIALRKYFEENAPKELTESQKMVYAAMLYLKSVEKDREKGISHKYKKGIQDCSRAIARVKYIATGELDFPKVTSAYSKDMKKNFDYNNIKPGDIIWTDSRRGGRHVVLYLGKNEEGKDLFFESTTASRRSATEYKGSGPNIYYSEIRTSNAQNYWKKRYLVPA